MKQLIAGLTMLAAVLFSAVLWAHVPVSRCAVQADNWIECQTRYDDNSIAADILMGLYSYDNTLMLSGRSDVKGVFRFELPYEPFYLLMDAGSGHVFEVDWQDIDGLDRQRFAAESAY